MLPRRRRTSREARQALSRGLNGRTHDAPARLHRR
jgi:hypothetical protein